MSRNKNTMKNGTAVAAQRRKAGPMKHRLQPRGGARNSQADACTECGGVGGFEMCTDCAQGLDNCNCDFPSGTYHEECDACS
jgi:hypothetical protein